MFGKLSGVFVAFSLILGALTTSGQTYFFKKFGVEDGLPRSGVYSLCEDKDGYLWIGVDGGGVAIFDGYDFEVMDEDDGLPSLDVRDIIQDSKGRMWLGTTHGILVVDGNKKILINKDDGLEDIYIRTLCESPEGTIWVGTANGIFIIKDSLVISTINKSEGLLHKKVTSIIKDRNNKMWVGTDDGITIYSDTKPERTITIDDCLASNSILYLFEDRKGTVWMGTKYGVGYYKNNQLACYASDEQFTNLRVRAIAEDGLGNIWFGTYEGVTRYDGKNFLKVTENNGLNHNRVRDIISDRNGNIWVGTYFGGISRYSGDTFIRFGTKEQLAGDNIISVSGNNNNLIAIGTGDGITLAEYKTDLSVQIKAIKQWPEITANALSLGEDSSIWAATDFGLFHLKDGEPDIYGISTGMESDEIKSMSKTGNIFWLGTTKCITKIVINKNNNVCKNYSFEVPVEEVQISAILPLSDKEVYAGDRYGFLYKLNTTTEKFEIVPAKGVKNITDLDYHDGILIISTDGFGVFAWDVESGKVLLNLRKADGLVSDHVFLMQKGSSNVWWLGTQQGLNRLQTDWHTNPTELKFFGIHEGFFGLETTERTSWSNSQGNIWFGTVDGLIAFNPESYQKNNNIPSLFVTSIHINGVDWTRNENVNVISKGGRFNTPSEFEVDYYNNKISFSFTGINLSNPRLTRYYYKLEGLDEDWTGPVSRRDITFNSLPAGNFTLLLKACNEDGICTEPVIAASFEVLTPFWQRTWFYIVVAITLVTITILITQWRVRSLKAAKHKLEDLVNERTSELRKEKELVEEQNERINRQRDALEEYNKAVTDSINYARRIQSAMMKPARPETGHLAGKVFILYKPKDIVSGDFFWYSETEDSTYITAADCTGHGVPGALMSMIGMAYLNEIMKSVEKPKPDYILFQLRKKIIEGVLGDTKDGMDMALCRICWNESKVQFSGANNPLYIIRNHELIELNADKMPIGEHDHKEREFTLHEHELKKGDQLFLFSDGYPDQFGGDRGKKLMKKRFKEILQEVAPLEVQQQCEYLDNQVKNWMEGYEQNDDILVIGIRF